MITPIPPPIWGVQLRESTGFARPLSAHTAQKTPEIHQVFPEFSILSERIMALAKLHCTAKREIFVSGEAKSAGILALYSEHFQRSPPQKDPICGCRIPKLRAPLREHFVLPVKLGAIVFGFSVMFLRRPHRYDYSRTRFVMILSRLQGLPSAVPAPAAALPTC